MRDVHTIRLRGPWQIEPLMRYVATSDGRFAPTTESLPATITARMPAAWSETIGSDFYGRVRYARRFHEPTGLEDREEVWLAIGPQRSRATIVLNGQKLGEACSSEGSARWDITAHLREINVLEIEVDHPQLDSTGRPTEDSEINVSGGLTGEVWLEIGFPD